MAYWGVLEGTMGTTHECFETLYWVIVTPIVSSVIYLSSHGNVDSKSIMEHHRAGGSCGVGNRVLHAKVTVVLEGTARMSVDHCHL